MVVRADTRLVTVALATSPDVAGMRRACRERQWRGMREQERKRVMKGTDNKRGASAGPAGRKEQRPDIKQSTHRIQKAGQHLVLVQHVQVNLEVAAHRDGYIRCVCVGAHRDVVKLAVAAQRRRLQLAEVDQQVARILVAPAEM